MLEISSKNTQKISDYNLNRGEKRNHTLFLRRTTIIKEGN